MFGIYPGERCGELKAFEKSGVAVPAQWKIKSLPAESERKRNWFFRWMHEMMGTKNKAKANGKKEDKEEKKGPEDTSMTVANGAAASEALPMPMPSSLDTAAGSGSAGPVPDAVQPEPLALAVLEAQQTRAEAARLWEQICADKRKLDEITREACKYTLSRYQAPTGKKGKEEKRFVDSFQSGILMYFFFAFV